VVLVLPNGGGPLLWHEELQLERQCVPCEEYVECHVGPAGTEHVLAGATELLKNMYVAVEDCRVTLE